MVVPKLKELGEQLIRAGGQVLTDQAFRESAQNHIKEDGLHANGVEGDSIGSGKTNRKNKKNTVTLSSIPKKKKKTVKVNKKRGGSVKQSKSFEKSNYCRIDKDSTGGKNNRGITKKVPYVKWPSENIFN